jgi:hypothetical protein
MGIKVDRAEPPLAQFYVDRQPWLVDAACIGIDPELFFDAIENRDPTHKLQSLKKAKATCFKCPVRRECAEQAMKEEGSAPAGRYGYRGAMTPAQRRALYRRGGLRGRDPKRLAIQSIK